MASIKYLASIVAAAGFAAAQSSCSVSATTTIQNAGDATALSSCRTFTGSIALSTDVSGPLALDGISRIRGSLIANNATQLTSLSANMLTNIEDTFGLTSLTRMSVLNMPYLTQVDTIDWSALPALQGLSLSGGVRMAKMVSIQNTNLQALDGINLQSVDQLVLANNRFLDRVSMQLGNVSDQLRISANGRNVVAEFPNLIWALNMTIANVSSLSIPSLQTVNGSLSMAFNYFTNVTAPNLTDVGALAIYANSKLTGVSFPQLTTVNGALFFANNTVLEKINGFPELATVSGALDSTGVFDDIEFPALKEVSGAFNVQTTKDIQSECDGFRKIAGSDNVIRGPFNCNTTNTPTSADGTLTGTSGGSGARTSTGAANAVVITGATGLLGVVAAIFGLL